MPYTAVFYYVDITKDSKQPAYTKRTTYVAVMDMQVLMTEGLQWYVYLERKCLHI